MKAKSWDWYKNNWSLEAKTVLGIRYEPPGRFYH